MESSTSSPAKDWRVFMAPLAFFALVIGVKTYYLVDYVVANRQLLGLITDPSGQQMPGETMAYYLTGQFSHIAYYATALAFDVLVLYSFLVRRGAKERPKGFWAISYLRATFGLRAAVRELVTTGPYSRIRHPLCRSTPSFTDAPVFSGRNYPVHRGTRGTISALRVKRRMAAQFVAPYP